MPWFPSSSFLMAQTVKNLPAVQETWVQALGQEEPLEKRRGSSYAQACVNSLLPEWVGEGSHLGPWGGERGVGGGWGMSGLAHTS